MEAVFLRLFNMSIAAGWLILAVALLRLVLKRAPRAIVCALWALVAVRLVCPVSPESALSLIPSAETVPQEILTAGTPVVHTGIAALNQAVNPILQASLAPSDGGGAAVSGPDGAEPAGAGTAAQASPRSPMQTIVSIASVVWAVGVGAMVCYMLVSFLRVRRRVTEAMHLRGNLWLCDSLGSPFILGVLRPRIYLPSGLSDGQARLVVAHETAHLARRDHWWKPLGFLLLAVYWFNPLCWAAYILLCRDVELACDEKVVRALGAAEKKAYSETLLACSVPRGMIAACPLAFGEVGVKARIKSVLSYKKPAFWLILAAVVACIVLAVCFLTNPAEELDDPFGKRYGTDGVVYLQSGLGENCLPDEAFVCTLTDDGRLVAGPIPQIAGADAEPARYDGALEEVKLAKDDFDRLFFGEGEDAARKLRRNNAAAWRLVEGERFFYLLQQDDGTLLLVCGWHDPEGETDPMSDDSSVHWALRLKPSDGGAVESGFAGVGKTYVSLDCLYMSPLSSFAAMGGNSGVLYRFEQDAVSMTHRTYGTTERIAVDAWQWEAFPYTQAEWDALFVLGGASIEGYDEILYLRLDDTYSLLRPDGQLWLVELHGNRQGGQHVWSVYSLIEESLLGFAQWDYQPVFAGYDAFTFEFGEQMTVTSAVCTQSALTVSGSAMRWTPLPEDASAGAEPVTDAQIHFTVDDGDWYSGTIYLTGEPLDGGGMRYTARVVGSGLAMTQDAQTGYALIAPIGQTAVFENPDTAVQRPETGDAAATGGDGAADGSGAAGSGGMAADGEFDVGGFTLDGAVTAAIIDRFADGRGDYDTASHVILATREVSGTPPVGQTGHRELVEVYAMAMHLAVGYAGGGFELVSGVHVPVVVTLEIDRANGDTPYTIAGVWTPGDGTQYVADIREKFGAVSDEAAENALDTQKYVWQQTQQCYAQAIAYGAVDTESVIAGLLDVIASSPLEQSNPGAYIDAHALEFRELIYYGAYTLQYCFAEFLSGGQTDLRGHLMAAACREILAVWGEEALSGGLYMTGQDWFDSYLAHARSLSGDELAQRAGARLLLQMADAAETAGAQAQGWTALSEAELAWFNESFFNVQDVWESRVANGFLTSEYADVTKLDLAALFYSCPASFTGLTLSDDELTKLEARGVMVELDVDKITRTLADAVLGSYAGITLDEVEGGFPAGFVYLAEYDAWYHAHGDTNYQRCAVLSGQRHEDGTVRLQYRRVLFRDELEEELFEATLREGAGGYQFVSNVRLEG